MKTMKLFKKYVVCAAVPALLLLTAGSARAALVLGDAVYPYSTQAQPAKGASYVDGTYGVTVTRMTSSSADTGRWGSQVEYSTWDPESSDGQYVLVQTLSDLNNAGGYVVYTRATNSVYRTLTFQNSNGQNEEPRWDRSGNHPTWLYYRSNKQLRYIDVADNTDHLVRDFTSDFSAYGSTYYIWNGDEGSCSADSRYWAFMLGTGNSNIVRIFTYDKQTNTIVGTLDATGTSINSVSMSPSGQYIYVAFDYDGSGTYHDRPHIFKNNFTSPVQACHTIPHGSWAYDKQGREVYVYLNAFPDEDVIGFVRADTGQTYKVYPQSLLGWNGSNVNFSAPGIAKKGWALCSEYSDSGFGYWSDNQIYMVELDETKVYGGATPPRIVRLGPTQTYTGSNYYYQQPNATINTAGTRVYFSANWRNVNGNEEVYRIDLPATWYEDLGGTPPVVTVTAPSGLTATAVSTTTLSLAWTDNSNNESSFNIERKTGVGGTYAQIATPAPNTVSYTNTGLTAGATYYYRVRASSGAVYSAYSNESSVCLPVPSVPVTVAAPSGLTATAVSTTTVALAWTDNATNESTFCIERKTGAGGAYAQIATPAANTVSHTNTGLSAGTTYYYRTRAALDAVYSAYSNEASVCLPVPSGPVAVMAPSGLTAVALSSSTIALTWFDNSSDETGFMLERKAGVSGTYAQIAAPGVNATSFTNTGLLPATTYYYRVRANGNVVSAYAPAANACTGPAPAPPSATVHSIRGYVKTAKGVGISGVTMQVTGDTSGSALTAIDGSYQLASLPAGGTYTVTASKKNYKFNPSVLSYTALAGNLVNQNMVARRVYSIRGTVAADSGSSIAAATVVLSGAAALTGTTDTNGSYVFDGLDEEGSYVVTVTKDGYIFDPAVRSTTTLAGSLDDWNFRATYLAMMSSGEMKVLGSAAGRGTINPDNGDSAWIYFKGTERGTYELSIFTLAGELLWEAAQDNVREGSFEWKAADLASGTYVASIAGPGFAAKKKIIVVR